MVALGATKYFMASQKAETNSVSSRDLAVSLKRLTRTLPSHLLPELQHCRHDHDHGARQRQKHFPAEPHQLIVAIARHEGLDHGDEEKQEANLADEPEDPRNPVKGRDHKHNQPTS